MSSINTIIFFLFFFVVLRFIPCFFSNSAPLIFSSQEQNPHMTQLSDACRKHTCVWMLRLCITFIASSFVLGVCFAHCWRVNSPITPLTKDVIETTQALAHGAVDLLSAPRS